MVKKSKASPSMDRVKNAILKVSKQLKIHPSQVSKKDLLTSNADISDWALKMVGGLNVVKNAYFPIEEKELHVIHDNKKEANYVRKLEKELGASTSIENRLRDVLSNLPKISVIPYKSKKKEKINRQVNIVLSDLHIGSNIKKSETGQLDFGITEESRRLARITKEVMGYKPQYRAETTLNVLLLGDLIQNSLHDARDGAPLAEQAARAIHLLSQMIGHFSNSYPSVTVYCNTGNHGRNTGRHHGRAVNQKWDSIETIIGYSLKTAASSLKNVKFVIPKTPYVTYDVFGKKVFATHGDTVLNPGYPGKAINVGSIEAQINKINSSLNDTDEYSVFYVGHVHTASTTHLANGSVLITNGPMVPSDEFAVSIGLMEVACGQMLTESVKDFPVGDTRYIRVSEKDDKDSSLDSIIVPFKEL
jgi:hypothetical protein